MEKEKLKVVKKRKEVEAVVECSGGSSVASAAPTGYEDRMPRRAFENAVEFCHQPQIPLCVRCSEGSCPSTGSRVICFSRFFGSTGTGSVVGWPPKFGA